MVCFLCLFFKCYFFSVSGVVESVSSPTAAVDLRDEADVHTAALVAALAPSTGVTLAAASPQSPPQVILAAEAVLLYLAPKPGLPYTLPQVCLR
jgi:hypothetical protein